MHSYAQLWSNVVAVITHSYGRDAQGVGPFEADVAPRSKPANDVASGSEPDVERAQGVEEPDIEVAPQPVGRRASVVPEGCEHAAGIDLWQKKRL